MYQFVSVFARSRYGPEGSVGRVLLQGSETRLAAPIGSLATSLPVSRVLPNAAHTLFRL